MVLSLRAYCAALLSVFLFAGLTVAADAAKPNIIVIVGDDMGYADIGVHGSKEIPTPHLDALANTGVRFTSGYVSGPYCSPTRAGLLTGRYQQRFGHEFNPGQVANATVELGLPLTETTLPARLKKAGYQTGMVGKWHLGNGEKFHPLSRGFDEFYGFLGGAHTYFIEKGQPAQNPLLRGREQIEEKEYLTDAFAREAVSYIERHKSAPFFLYLTFNAVHTPLEATDKYKERFPNISDEKRKSYAGMMSAMDDAIGRVVEKLAAEKLDENTLIFFISDNGGPPANSSNNGKLRGYKATTWEGGVRVPFIANWKGKLPAGQTYDKPVIQLDLAPTALAAAGAEVPADAKFDGVNLLPYIQGENKDAPHDKLYWRFGQQTAIRSGDWKLVKANPGLETLLVNVTNDIGESKDLSAENPEKRKELEAAWEAWNKELSEPLWKPNPNNNQNKKKKNKNKAD